MRIAASATKHFHGLFINILAKPESDIILMMKNNKLYHLFVACCGRKLKSKLY